MEAFQATLEELQYADLLLHVIDAGDKEREAHIAVVDRLIEQLAKPGTPVLRCYNKCDTVDPDDLPGSGIPSTSPPRPARTSRALKGH